MHSSIQLPITYAFMHRDFIELAGKIPDAVPRVILDQLTRKSLLFLGSGLGDDSIESLVRSKRMGNPQHKLVDWAILIKPRRETRMYWRQLGVEITDTTLQAFMRELHKRVDALAPA
jgi:hypothetical protein